LLEAAEHLQRAVADRYVVERELGRGGMATVYLARDPRHGRRVAIKVFRSEYSAGVAADRFRSEIEIAAALAHPSILPVFDSGAADDLLYYVMPYIEGESLRELLTRDRILGVDAALRIARDVGEALAYAHARGIVHRDIKPENILLVESRAIVADFGIARALANATDSTRLTLQGTALGTPLYMSPEQAVGDRDVDGRSDLYSLATMLYEMLAGSAPHTADTPREIINRKLAPNSAIPALSRADVPEDVEQAIRRALDPDPLKRFDTTGEFLEAVAPSATSSPHLLAASRANRLVTRRRVISAVVVVAAVAGAALWRVKHPPLTADDGRVAIAVLPFRATVASAREWTEAVPDLLATALDGTPDVRVVDPWALWRTLRSETGDAPRAPDPGEAAQLSKSANATCYVLGSIAELRGRVDITARIYRRGRAEPWRTLFVSGSVDSVSSLVQRLAIDLIAQLSITATRANVASFDHGLTRSPDALKAWLTARALHRRGKVDSAEIAIQRAITLDSTFAFALIEAVEIKSWLQFMRGQMFSDLMPLAERAVVLSDSLPERQRLRAEAMLASIRTEGARAARALERIVAIDSADVAAWSLLSYVNLVYGWQFGRGEQEAMDAAERSLRLDSTDATSLSRLSGIALSSNSANRLDDVMRRLARLDTTTALVRSGMRSIEAVRATDAEFERIAQAMSEGPAVEWVTVLRALRVFRPDRADMLSDRLYRGAAPQSRRMGLGALVQMFAAEGHWSGIDSLRRARAFGIAPDFEATVDRITAAAAVAGVTDEATGRRAVDALAATLSPERGLALFNTRQVWLEGWLIAAWHAMYGDTSVTRRWDAAMATFPKGGSPREYAASLRADLESRLAARRSDRRAALAHAGRALDLWSIHTSNTLELMPEPAMRFQLATLLRAEGKTDSAATLFRSLVPPTTWLGFYTARAALEFGELCEARGDRVLAERSFLTSLRLWERGDSIVAPFRERARRGLARSRG
jgi:hypothetical protein